MTAYNVLNAASMTAGQPEDVSVILANFQALAAVLNGNLDNSNLSPVAAIAASKLAGYPSDPLKSLRGDGTWLGIGYSTSLPTIPVDGQQHILVDSITAPTYQWHFRYNAGGGTYKWEFVGGTPMVAQRLVQDTMSWTSGGWNAHTNDPSLTLPRAGTYLVEITGTAYPVTAAASWWMGLRVGATDPTADGNLCSGNYAAVAQARATATVRATLTAAAATALAFRWQQNAGAQNFIRYNACMTVLPVAVS